MGREVSSELEPLLGLDGCVTHSTLSLYPVTGDPIHYATDDLTFGGKDYSSNLVRIDEVRQSIGVATDRLSGEAQQVTKDFGILVATEAMVKAVGVVGRYYRHPKDPAQEEWVELFRGEFIALETTEGGVKLEVLHDLVAAGYCVANWTLAENCQFVYKHAGTCGFAGADPTCNKRRKSLGGCAGKIVTGTTTNEYRFGGMEFPDIQPPSPPSGSGSGGGIGGPGGEGDPGFPPHTCPTLDQWVLARGRGYRPIPVQVRDLTQDDELYHPCWKTFHEIDVLRVVPMQAVWRLETENGAAGNSSFTHPVLWYREHSNGSPVSRFMENDPVLTASPELEDTRTSRSNDAGRYEDVMAITLVDGRIYCYSDKPEGPFIVCHNKEQWQGGYVN